MEIPDSMKAELAAWNNGKGIDLMSWIGCEGRFALAIGYATIFWPSFVEIDGYVVRTVTDQSLRSWASADGATRQSVEAMVNHEHLADFHYLGCPDCSSDKLRALGRILKEIYEAKLAWQFPDKKFCVSLYEPEDPEDLRAYEITFWQTTEVAT
jgi:hypothetical protein